MGKQLPQSGSSLGQSRKPEGKPSGTGISSRYKVYEMVKEWTR